MRIFIKKLSKGKELLALTLMLEMLHLSIWFDFGSTISRSFMLSHLGLFLIWQPIWQHDKKLSIANIVLFLVFTLTLTIWLNLWLLFAWLVLLIGLMSGYIDLHRNVRAIYILAVSFLILELLFFCVPELANLNIKYNDLYRLLLPLIPILILAFPVSKTEPHTYKVDFIHAITTSMLTGLVALGSLLNMFLNDTSYFTALTQTLIAISGAIICISWLLTSQYWFSGVTQIWSIYILNIGTPFEEWLSDLSKLNELDLPPEAFLEKLMQKLNTLSWVSGVEWKINETIYAVGDKTTHEIKLLHERLTVCVYTYSAAGTSLKLHSNLLVKLLYNFYLHKEREKESTNQAHLKAIYETGARITHDIKNILQSLQAITNIIKNDTNNTSKQILKRQMPNLSQRLQLALDKLQVPQSDHKNEISLNYWWHELQKRNAHDDKLSFQAELHDNPMVPVDLFDSVIDNLLENARSKRNPHQQAPLIAIRLIGNSDSVRLTVCDTGNKIPEHIACDLLSTVIKSDHGLGIGLYQANKYAQLFGYHLSLINNQTGNVCFEFVSTNANTISG